MAESIEDKVQIESQQCRVCLENQGSVPIYGDDSHPDISNEFMTFGSVEVDYDDEFSKLLCKKCFILLDGAVCFRKAAIRSNTILKEQIKEVNNTLKHVKSEIDIYPAKNYEAWPRIVIDQSFLKRNRTESHDSPLNVKIEVVVNDEFDNEDDCEPLIATKIKQENLKCKTCNLIFQSPDELEVHEPTCTFITPVNETRNKPEIKRRRSRVKDQKCEICNVDFTKNMYPKHMLKVHGVKLKTSITPVIERRNNPEIKRRSRVKDQKCEICNVNFTKNMYPKHMLKDHDIKLKTKECSICKKMFRSDYLKIHMHQVHAGERKPKQKVECPVCKKIFAPRYYRMHIRTHDESKGDYICEICGKDFKFQYSFIKHKATHTNHLPFKCDYCPYRGRNKELLRIHTRSHTRDYPYECDQCGARSVTKSNLNRHMHRHRDSADYICDTCKKGFYSKLELERHIIAVHLGIKNHLCNLCGAPFSYRRTLTKHMRNVHKTKGIGGRNALYLKLQPDGTTKTQ